MSKTIISFILILSCNVFSVSGQNQDNQYLKAAREIIEAANTCALITTDQNGNSRVRAMDPFTPDEEFNIWFGTNSNSRKVKQIKGDSTVSIYYMENDQSSYVTIFGKAELIDDLVEKDKRWKEEWKAFYQDDKKNYILIKVVPEWLEISSAKRGINNDPISWTPPRVEFKKRNK